MNYDEIKAQYMDPSSRSARSERHASGQTSTERIKTPLDKMIRLVPFALAFFAAVIGGTYYLQNTESVHAQFQQWTGRRITVDDYEDNEVANEEVDPDQDDTGDSVDGGQSYGPFDEAMQRLGY